MLKDAPGKGKGLFATRPIARGECVHCEPPLFTTASLKDPAHFERDLGQIVRALPKEGQRAFLSLHNNNPGSQPFTNLMRSNGYPLGPGSEVGGVFPVMARINHSCKANCQHAWDDRVGMQLIHAVRDIDEGEELSLAYHNGGTTAERRATLKTYFGFYCECELCSLPPKAQRRSDERAEEAKRLDEAIGVPDRAPEEALADCSELVHLFAEEQVTDLRVPRLYYDAFQICAKHSDEARASVFAKRAAEARIICEGKSREVENLQSLAENPARFEGFGKTKKLKTRRDDVPTGVSQEKFDRWLWRG